MLGKCGGKRWWRFGSEGKGPIIVATEQKAGKDESRDINGGTDEGKVETSKATIGAECLEWGVRQSEWGL